MPAEPCCTDRCRYAPDSVRRVLKLVRAHGVDDLQSILTPLRGYDGDRVSGFGPSFGPQWRLYAADLDRARLAGHRTPEAMAAYLCPFSDMVGDDDLLEAA